MEINPDDIKYVALSELKVGDQLVVAGGYVTAPIRSIEGGADGAWLDYGMDGKEFAPRRTPDGAKIYMYSVWKRP